MRKLSTNETFARRLPNQIEAHEAEQLHKIIASQLAEDEMVTLSLVLDQGTIETVTLSPALTQSLLNLLHLVSSGRGFRMVPLNQELTTQQAADILNVSRPHLVKLLENGSLPFVKTGAHRRVKAEDLFAYKKERDEQRAHIMSEMIAEDADLI